MALAKLHRYGPHLTSHDVVKLVAILLMFIDHIGFFFAPDQLWWRAVGRMSFPLFFFLAGYARPGRMDPVLIGLAVWMIALDAFTFNPIFPFNALVSIVVARYAIGKLEARGYAGGRLGELYLVML